MIALRLLLVALVVACGSDPAGAPAGRTAAPAAVTDASDLYAKYECARCHEVPRVAAADPEKSCVTCHQQIHAGMFSLDGEPVDRALLALWKSNIHSLRWAPSLVLADRLRRDWVRAFLLAPHDVRPGLPAEMPRLALTAVDADRLAAALVPTEDSSAAIASDATRGAQLYAAKACATCHRFTGTTVDDASKLGTDQAAVALAPDLRQTRERMTPASIALWLVVPRGAMPSLGLSEEEARALTAFLVSTPLAPKIVTAPPQRLPVLDRAVTWDEVETTVFRDTCWHCHSEPDFARGDGGPGNTGGFGFAGRGLNVTSYAAISAGSLDDSGERRSIFAKLPDGTPRLVAHLLARHTEVAGGTVPGVRGMPFGLPPLPLETIQLVDTWIAQGRPRGAAK